MPQRDEASQEAAPGGTRLLTSQEVATRLGVSLPTLSRWRAEGEGPAFLKLGRGPKAPVRYRAQELERYLLACETRRESAAGWVPEVA